MQWNCPEIECIIRLFIKKAQRNDWLYAADHGADNDENGQMWTITRDTALIYPCIVAIAIKDILQRDSGYIEV